MESINDPKSFHLLIKIYDIKDENFFPGAERNIYKVLVHK
jgi:hypothetical protein